MTPHGTLCPPRPHEENDRNLAVAVVGGGITGLTAAWHLQKAGVPVAVFEASARVGGAIGAMKVGGWLHELGPNSMLENSAEVVALVEELGLAAQRVYASESAQKRFIVRDGAPCEMPASPLGFLRTELFSWRAKFALLGEPFRAPAPPEREESVAEFVERRLGREFLDYAINPFVAGVYAGDPRKLSVKQGFPKLWKLEQEHGSLIRGALARRNASGGPKGRMFSFRDGLPELPRTLARKLGVAVRKETRVAAARRVGERWEIDSEGLDGARRETFSAVVCALPPDALAALHFENVPGAERLRELRAVEQPPVVSVFTGYVRDAVEHPLDGFGLLVPEVEHGRILGTLFSSSLFPGRAPDGHVGLTTFVGGVRQPELASLGDAAIQLLVQEELERLIGVSGEPVFVHVQRWPRAIPQYTLGYGRILELCASAEKVAPGLFIGGNGRDGISLSNCIAGGRRLAGAVQAALARH